MTTTPLLWDDRPENKPKRKCNKRIKFSNEFLWLMRERERNGKK